MRSFARPSPSPAALRASAPLRGARRKSQTRASSRFHPIFKPFGALVHHQPVNMKYCFIQFECDDTFGRFGGLAEAKHGASEQSRQGVAQIVQLSVA